MQLTRRKRSWRRVAAGLLAFLVLYTVLCFVLGKNYLSPARHVPVMPAWCFLVSVPTPAGPDPAWATPGLAAGKGAPVVFVMAHGYGGNRDTWKDLLQELPKRGFDAVAPCMPGQDASPDRTVGFGVKEARVVVDTVKWVRSQYKGTPPKIVLLGLSMGGASVWLASAIDPSVDGVVSEGAYANFEQAMNTWFDRKAPGASVYLKPVVWFASSLSGIKPGSVLPVESAALWKGKPALVVQGAEDHLIVRSHADRLSVAAGCPDLGGAWCGACAVLRGCSGRVFESVDGVCKWVEVGLSLDLPLTPETIVASRPRAQGIAPTDRGNDLFLC